MAGKFLGSILVLIACFSMGYRLSVREKFRLDELLYFKSAIIKIISELEHNRATFCEAMSMAVNIEENDIFGSIYNAVKNNNTIKTAWKYAFEENADNCYMTAEDIERLSIIGDGFNSGDIELQKKYVNNAVEYINSQENIINQKLDKDKKVYRSVSITVGLFIVLLLI
ncbi:MAG: stage III sporulation protein AB [Clostridia bacterium]|nr:stage III sporulation protein AB [Clostridia bacterium]